MGEQSSPLTVEVIKYICYQCKEGEMFPEGNIALTSNPPQYPHKCSKCGYTINLTSRYPRINILLN